VAKDKRPVKETAITFSGVHLRLVYNFIYEY
jgi:hypothetical protein